MFTSSLPFLVFIWAFLGSIQEDVTFVARTMRNATEEAQWPIHTNYPSFWVICMIKATLAGSLSAISGIENALIAFLVGLGCSSVHRKFIEQW